MKFATESRGNGKSQICIVGVGAVTAVGLTAPSAAAAVRAGIPGFGEHPFMVDRQGEPMVVAAVPSQGEEADGNDRFGRLAKPALREALLPVESHRREIGDIPLFIGLPPQRPGRPAELERQMTDALGRVGGISSVDCTANGHAAGLMALGAAARKVIANPSGFYLAGGVDSYLEPETLEWLEANDQLHGGPNAYGFTPGEAAGFCLLCSHQAAERYRLQILARVWAAATARETKLIKTETVCLGKGLTEVFEKVFAQLPSPTAKVDDVICDMNGETYRAGEYGFAVSRLSNRFVNASDFVAPADCWGDVGAASGPLFVSMVAAAGQRGYTGARFNLLWTSSETGERSAVIAHQEQTRNYSCQ
jgi:3-oxoacyl-[acyl-carrier-protein] synthase-1